MSFVDPLGSIQQQPVQPSHPQAIKSPVPPPASPSKDRTVPRTTSVSESDSKPPADPVPSSTAGANSTPTKPLSVNSPLGSTHAASRSQSFASDLGPLGGDGEAGGRGTGWESSSRMPRNGDGSIDGHSAQQQRSGIRSYQTSPQALGRPAMSPLEGPAAAPRSLQNDSSNLSPSRQHVIHPPLSPDPVLASHSSYHRPSSPLSQHHSQYHYQQYTSRAPAPSPGPILPPPPQDSRITQSLPPVPDSAVFSEGTSSWSNPRPSPRSPIAESTNIQRERERQRAIAAEAGEIRSSVPSRTSTASAARRVDEFLKLKIASVEKNRRDLIWVRFDVTARLSSFRASHYANITRSYAEFQRLVEALAARNPQTIIPPLPPPQTSAPDEGSDLAILRGLFQKWCDRVSTEQSLLGDEELRSFVESDFGYQPVYIPKKRRQGAPASKVRSRQDGPAGASSSYLGDERSTHRYDMGGTDDDGDLDGAIVEMGHFEERAADVAALVHRVAKDKRAMLTATQDLADKLSAFSTTEPYAPLAQGLRRLSKTERVLGDNADVEVSDELVTLADGMSHQSVSAMSAQEALFQRESVLDEHRAALKAVLTKKRNAEKLKGSTKISSDRVNEAITDLAQAQQNEQILTRRVQAISTTLRPSLVQHTRHMNSDLLSCLMEHARSNLVHEKQSLQELEAVASEISKIAQWEGGPEVVVKYVPSPAPISRSTSNSGSISSTIGPLAVSPSFAGSFSENTANGSLRAPSEVNGHYPTGPISTIPTATQSMFLPRPDYSHQRSVTENMSARETGDGSSMSRSATLGRRTVNDLARSVYVAPQAGKGLLDERQRVDAKMAAQSLANLF